MQAMGNPYASIRNLSIVDFSLGAEKWLGLIVSTFSAKVVIILARVLFPPSILAEMERLK